jgi:glutathione S-transferase
MTRLALTGQPIQFAPMLLYNSQVSGNCYKVRLLFSHLGIDYERHELSVIDRSNRTEVLGELNPSRRVPTLVLDDGRSLGESNAIISYFAEDTEYLPEDRFERAQVLQWLFFEQYSHEPNIAVARFWRIAGIAPPAAELGAKLRGGEVALAALERHLTPRQFLVAERYTVADIALYAYTHVAPEGGFDLEPYPAIREWLTRVVAQPGHVPITA